ncbi:hypothetical protein BJ684DRAFT_19783 [Piptocephalis cylindrospora]|uniref:RING-type domain-containing protein n=1 Tax=Piptocephalis cylindrospora TaxID=1907219 RepID=A0A4P9Y456_9FUNG|nr:hypothetical protein BJ684DRAFT_19783 [Piptocephalis cylindrospora]|eukprot:RKP13758.1 hypothetical protein BJ684DRAFT_19783 [Piptocephalis cylindrospora]
MPPVTTTTTTTTHVTQESVDEAEVVDLTHPPSQPVGKKRGIESVQESNASQQEGSDGSDPPAKRPAFTCAICLSPPEHMTSTSCGHTFCYRCILRSIRYSPQCPTCRKRQTRKELLRLYAFLRPAHGSSLPPSTTSSEASPSSKTNSE